MHVYIMWRGDGAFWNSLAKMNWRMMIPGVWLLKDDLSAWSKKGNGHFLKAPDFNKYKKGIKLNFAVLTKLKIRFYGFLIMY